MKLSIIVPVYNTRDFLAKCLDSLVFPEQEGYEIIAVNDGSTDDSGEILKQYASRYPKLLRVLETPNGGLGHARNTGLEAAQGEFLLFVDSDDWLAEGAVLEMFGLLDEEFDIAVFDFVQVDEQDRELAYCTGCDRDTAFALEEYPEFLFAPHNAVNKLWRRDLFTKHGVRFPDRLWFEDLATSPRLYLGANRIRPVRKAWYCYFQRSGSIMQNTSAAVRNAEMTEVADLVISCYQKSGAWDKYQKQLEYKFYYEEYLASVTRVNQIDAASPLQKQLRDDYLRRFPDYRKNPYVSSSSLPLRALDRMIREGHWEAVRMLVKLNNIRKGR